MLLATLLVLGIYKSNAYNVSISGLSSGGAMAVQYSVAFSSEVTGVGVVAGLAYYCAEGKQLPAEEMCPEAVVARLVEQTKTFATEGKIDPVANIAKQKVYIFTGSKDTVVPTNAVDKVNSYYEAFHVPAANVKYNRNTLPCQHGMVTTNYGKKCGLGVQYGEPWIWNGGFDLAGAILQHIFGGTLKPKGKAVYDNLIAINQKQFVPSNAPAVTGLSDFAWVYIPTGCQWAMGTKCRVHVVFHGCQQTPQYPCVEGCDGRGTFNDTYVRHTGYNEWAETNQIIMLYPQAKKFGSTVGCHVNPEGCWDWWGFDGSETRCKDLDPNYAFKNGVQMATVDSMLRSVLG